MSGYLAERVYSDPDETVAVWITGNGLAYMATRASRFDAWSPPLDLIERTIDRRRKEAMTDQPDEQTQPDPNQPQVDPQPGQPDEGQPGEEQPVPMTTPQAPDSPADDDDQDDGA